MKKLEVYHNRHFNYVLVDDEDYERCRQHKWLIKVQRKLKNGRTKNHRYVYAAVLVNGEPRHLHLARFILDVPPEYRVTYVSDDPLNCQKSNLKVNGIRQDYPRPKGIPHWEILDQIKEEANGRAA
jgi:hypothetical protein